MSDSWSAPATARLLAEGRATQARAQCLRRCTEQPRDAEAWFLLGAARHRLGDAAAAVAAFDRATQIEPRDLRPRTAAAAVLAESGRTAEALQRFRAALALRPGDPRLLINTAIALESLDRGEEALAHYDRALAAFPGMGDALLNRTALALRLGRADEAFDDAGRLSTLFPDLPEAWFNRAEAALALHRYGEALAACERSLALDAGYARAWLDKAIALAALGRVEAGETALDQARAADPGAVAAFRNPLSDRLPADGDPLDLRRIALFAGWQRQQVCDWHDRDAVLAGFEAAVTTSTGTPRALRDRALMFPAVVLPLTPGTRRALGHDVAGEVARNAAAHAPQFSAHPETTGRLRIGYLSAEFHDHPSAYLARSLFAAHDRQRFEIRAYALQPGADPLRREIAARCDAFVDLAGEPDRAVATRIHADGVQILVDLTGYLAHGRPEVLAMRPAPVRVSLLGFPGSLGPGLTDYRVSDAITTPHALRGEFAEALARVPHTYFVCDDAVPDGPEPPARSRAALPDHALVLCCMNNPFKIEPRVFAVWMRLLRALPEAVLWLLDGPGATRANLSAAARAHGVDAARLVFAARVPRARHLQRLALADLFLDTLDCNAHVTACDALLAGVPVLTCPGTRMAARIGASLVTAADLPELVAPSIAEYERMALALAADAPQRARLRARLHARRGPLFATAERVRMLEHAYAHMWARHARGLAPADFDLPVAGG